MTGALPWAASAPRGTDLPVPGPPDLPVGVAVAGGAGGTLAHLADLDAAAGALDAAAAALDDASLEARRLAAAVDDGTVWSPTTAHGAYAAVAPLLASPAAPAAVAGRVRATAAAVRACARLYADADASSAAAVRGAITSAGVLVGGALGEAGPTGWAAAGGLALAAAGPLALLGIGGAALRAVPSPAALVLGRLGAPEVRADPGPLGVLARAGGRLGLVAGGSPWPDPRAVQLLTPGVAAMLRSTAPGRQPFLAAPVPAAARTLGGASALVTRALGVPRPGLVVAPVVRSAAPRGPADEPPAPTSTGDLLRHVATLYPHTDDPPGAGTGGVPGTVGVQRLDHADGSRSWVVAVPGTEEWSPVAGANPFDLSSNFDLVGGTGGDSLRTTVEAMTQAGIAPGEPVVLAGHSQGGVVAVTIAADPALAERFSVAAVVTAGAPASAVALPPGVPALHLEHAPDYVWTLDGAATPPTPDRTTVLVDLSLSPDAADRAAAASPVTAHGIGAYARTADRLTRVEHPSLSAFDAALTRALGDGSVRATTQRYVGVRVPEGS